MRLQRPVMAMHQLLLLLLLLIVHLKSSQAALCELKSGISSIPPIPFNESFGSYPGDAPLAQTGETSVLSFLNGTVRNASDPVGTNTVTLTLSDRTPLPQFPNRTEFSPSDLFFELGVSGGEGVLQMKQGVDREFFNNLRTTPGITISGGSFLMNVRCTVDADGTTRTLEIEVDIQDINDNSPVFYNTSTNEIQSNFRGSVAENTPANVLLLQGLAVRDMDAGLNRKIVKVSENSTFFRTEITTFDLQIFSNAKLDYESGQTSVAVLLVFRDSGSPSLSSSATVLFSVLDQDDQPPAFVVPGCTNFSGVCVNPTYTAAVVSGVNATSALTIQPGPIFARDLDALNFSIRYEIVGGNFTSSFVINNITGEVTQVAPINRSVAATVTLIIEATEFTDRSDVQVSGLYDTALLVVTVQSNDSSPPTLSLSLPDADLRIAENSPIGAVVGNVSGSPLFILVTDADLLASDAKPSYKFEVTNTNLFRANADGSISANSELIDYESLSSNKSIAVVVQVTETSSLRANLSSSISFTVNITDVNDNSPIFQSQSYAFTVNEGAGSRSVGRVAATDADTDQLGTAGITYSLVPANTSMFTINASTGDISVNGSLTRDEQYVLTVRASDSDPVTAFRRSAEVAVVVTVARSVNLPPRYSSSMYEVSVSEDTENGTVIGQFTASDPESEPITYSLISQSVTGAFAYDSAGRLSVNAVLDRESLGNHVVVIGARDSLSNRTASATVNVTLLDVNDNNPVIAIATTNFSIEENTAGVIVTDFNATDADMGVNAGMQLLLADPSGAFTVVTNSSASGSITGSLILSRALDFESSRVHYVTVIARDSGQSARSGTVTVTVNVVNRDDLAPLFPIRFYSGSAPENTVNASVVNVTAVDLEANPTITYRIVNTSSPFGINAATGEIYTRTAIDYEANSRFIILVSTDQSSLPAAASRLTATVTVMIDDLNDNSPQIPSGISLSAIETQPIGTAIGSVNATDADVGINALLRYSLRDVSPGSGVGLFSINAGTGQVTVARSLLTSRTDTFFTLFLSVRDAGSPSLTTNGTATVTVVRATEAPQGDPANASVSIDMTAAVGSSVFNLNATDADNRTEFSSPITYSLIGSAVSRELFSINSTSGLITVAQNLSFDISLTYQLLVSVSDPSRLRSTATVTVNVNRNLHSPTLTPADQAVSVQEALDMGVSIGANFTAADADVQAPFNTVRFSLNSSTPGALTYFTIDAASGQISLKQSLVGTSLTSARLLVTAVDGGTPGRSSPTVGVTVSVISNNAFPQFARSSYTFQLAGNATGDVAAIVATDADSPSLTYSLYGTYSSLFTHNGTHLLVNGNLGSASVPNRFFILLQAADTSIPPKTNRTQINIEVLRNYFSPSFNASSYSFSINETQPLGVAFGEVAGFDSDVIADERRVTFFSEDALIGVTAAGAVFIRQQLLPSSQAVFTGTIGIRDSGLPAQNSTITVTLNVRRNTAAPVFWPTSQRLNIRMTTTPSVIGSVFANDTDSVFGGTVRYNLIGDSNAAAFFSVDAVSGQISLTSSLVAETATSYQLRIEATDGANQMMRRAQSLVTVEVDRNLFAPEVTSSSVGPAVLVPETRQLGVVLATLVGRDQDAQAPYNQLTFQLVGNGSSLNYFDVSPTTGSVYLRRSLLMDTSDYYLLSFQATDGGTPPRISASLFELNVTVIRNRQSPVITNSVRVLSLTRSTVSGASVLTVTATDGDQPPFNELTFSLLGDSLALATFAINSSSGIVTTRTDLSSFANTEFRLVIQVSDAGSPARTNVADFVVQVDRNLASPEWFAPAAPSLVATTATVLETVGVDAVVFTCFANDSDSRSPFNSIRYSLLGDAAAMQYFTISATTGQITVRQSLLLDTMNTTLYNLTIGVSDAGTPNSRSGPNATVLVSVARNLNPPQFNQSLYRFLIDRNATVNSSVGSVFAVDADGQSPFNSLSYFLISDGFPSGEQRFNVSMDGVITTVRSLEADSAVMNYTLVVAVSDGGSPVKTATTIVIVDLRRNLNSPISYAIAFVVKETESPGALIGSLNSTDLDPASEAAGRLSYSFTSATASSSAGSLFFLSIDGQLFVQSPLVSASANVYLLNFVATDSGTGGARVSNSAQITVTIMRNQFTPQFINLPAAVTITRNVTVGSAVYSALANDSDSDVNGSPAEYSRITYSLVGDSSSPVYFSVNSVNGTVTLSRALTSLVTEFQLRIRAADAGFPAKFNESLLTVTVSRNLHSPIVHEAVNGSVHRFAVIGSDTGARINATDADVEPGFGTVIYKIADNQYFDINRTNGNIITKSSLLSITEASITVSVSAEDEGTPIRSSTAQQLHIAILSNILSPSWVNAPAAAVTVNASITNASSVIDLLVQDNDTDAFYNGITAQLMGDSRSQRFFSVASPNPQTADGLSVMVSVIDQILNDTADEYALQLRASDSRGCSGYTVNPAACRLTERTADTVLLLRVNRNLQAPMLMHANNFSLSIPEIQPVNQVLLQLNATENDTCIVTSAGNSLCVRDPGSLGQVQWNLQSPSSFVSEYFSFYSDAAAGTGYLALQKSLTEGSRNFSSVTLSFTAADGGGLSTAAQVTIQFTRNQFAPQFSNNNMSVSINETLPVGSLIGVTLEASDNDTQAPFNSLNLFITGLNNAAVFFGVHSNGSVYLLRSVGADSQTQYQLSVRASDGGVPSLTATATVWVTVQRNLNSPTWTWPNASSVTLQLAETAGPGNRIATLVATDADTVGSSGRIRYRISNAASSAEAACFHVDAESGDLLLAAGLARPPCTALEFNVSVTATDLGSPPRSTSTRQIVVEVQRNRQSPVIAAIGNFSIDYVAAVGSAVVTVVASDADAVAPFNSLSFSLVGDSAASEYFSINATSGEVTVKADFNATAQTLFSLRVRVSDGGTPSRFSERVFFVLVRRSLFAPVFSSSSYSFSLSERQSVGLLWLNQSVMATDNDATSPHNSVTYSITSSTPSSASGFFGVDSATGRLRLLRSLTELSFGVTSVTVAVRAADSGVPTRFASANVVFSIDRAARPSQTFERNRTVSLEQFTSIGTTVCCMFNISVVDTVDPVRFSFVAGLNSSLAAEYFYLDPLRGLLTLKKLLSGAAFSKLEFGIEARDSRWSAVHYVTVNAIRDSGSPFLSIVGASGSDSSFGLRNVTDFASAGVRIGEIFANDSFRGVANFRIVGQFPANFLFNITVNGSIATIVTAQALTEAALKLNNYVLEIESWDSFYPGARRRRSFSLGVSWRVGELVINSPSGGSGAAVIWERTAPGDAIDFNISVAQSASYGELRYGLLGDAAAASYFYINQLTGQLSLRQSLTSSSISAFNVTVSVTDGLLPTPNTAQVSVNVTVRRDTSVTVFSSATTPVSMLVNASVGSTVTSVTATDGDASLGVGGNHTVLYELTGVGSASGFFSIDIRTGRVSLKVSVANDTRDFYDLAIRAYTPDNPAATATTTIRVNVNRNLNIPRFVHPSSGAGVSVAERAAIGSIVYDFNATDADGDALSYQLTASSDAISYFHIDAATGVMRLSRSLLEFTTASSIVAQVTVTDNGRPNASSAVVSLTVSIMKDSSPPVFVANATEPLIDVAENASVGSTIGSVLATDPDANGTSSTGGITYSLVGSSPSGIFFEVDATNGSIRITRDLRADITLNYTLIIRALEVVSRRSSDTTVTVRVNRNPGRPTFFPANRSLRLLVNQRIGSLLLTAMANDSDSGDSIRYSLKDAAMSAYFYIHPITGQLYLIGSVSGLTSSSLNLTIVATDSGSVPKTAESVISVNLVRSSGDLAFSPQTISFSLNAYNYSAASLPQMLPIAINATSSDSGGSIRYRLDGVYPASRFFSVISDNGNVQLIALPLRQSTLSSSLIALLVRAYNTEFPTITATGFVNISLIYEKQRPTIISGNTSAVVRIDIAVGTEIFRVSASDVANEALRFNISDPSGVLYIDSITGIVTLKRPLVGTSGSISATVTACDTNFVQLCSDPVTYSLTVDNSTAVPQISNLPATINLAEFFPTGRSVFTVKATLNLVATASIRFEAITSGSSPSLLTVNSVTGTVTVNGSLEADTSGSTRYLLVIVAYDSDLAAAGRGSATGTLTVSVSRNLNSPIVDGNVTVGSVNVDESLLVGSVFYKLNASDADGDAVRFSLNTWSELFYIDRTTGRLSLRRTIFGRTETSYSLNISISDGRLPAQITNFILTISVTRDLSGPSAARVNFTAVVSENAVIGSEILWLNVTDADLLGNLSYSIVGDYPAQNFFSVNGTGHILIRQLLYTDVVRRAVYLLRIQVADTMRPRQQLQLTVQVQVQRNATGPAVLLKDYSATVCRTQAVGSVLLAGSSFNISRGSTSLRFSLLNSTGRFNDYFSLARSSGDVSVRAELSSWSGDSLAVVGVSDEFGRTQSGMGEIFVRLSGSALTVPARVVSPAVGSVLPAVTAATAAVNSTAFTVTVFNDQLNSSSAAEQIRLMASYSAVIVGDSLAAASFAIVKSATLDAFQNFSVVLSKSLMEDATLATWANFSMRFAPSGCELGSNLSTIAEFSLPIQRDTDAATFTPSSVAASVSVLTDIGSRLPINVSISDSSRSPLRPAYRCSLIPLAGAAFNESVLRSFLYVNPDTCSDFYLLRPLTQWRFGRRIRCGVRLRENWPSGSSISVLSSLNISLEFSSAAQSPQFTPAAADVNVTDTDSVGSAVAAFELQDLDLAGSLTFKLQGSSRAASVLFGIRQTASTNTSVTVEVFLLNGLRKDSSLAYQLTITGYDSAYPSETVTANVTVTVQRNIGRPVFSIAAYARNIGPKFLIGSTVISVNATDSVDNDTITYSLGGSATDREFFFVRRLTGEVVLRKSLQLTTVTRFSLRVQASDSGIPSRTTEATVTVTVLRNESVTPVFTESSLSANVSELAAVGSFVVNLTASSVVTPELIRYTAIGDGLATSYFAVHNVTGEVSVSAQLTLETVVQMILRVRAYTLADPTESSILTLTLNILRNQFAPVFASTNFSLSLNESTTTGSLVFTFNATDSDFGSRVTYRLESDATNDAYFFMNSLTGRLYLRRSLTLTSQRQFLLTVVATDSGPRPQSGTTQLLVTIPRDAFAVVFNSSSSSVSINYTMAVGSVFYVARAFDVALLTDLQYSISSADNFYFGIDANTGGVSVARSLLGDTRRLTEYSLNITCRQRQHTQNIAWQMLTVRVARNLFPPQFSRSLFEFSISELATVGTSLGFVLATDADAALGKSEKLMHRIFNASVDGYFFISSLNGEISLQRSLTGIAADFIQLTVIASDTGPAVESAVTTVNISITKLSRPSLQIGQTFTASISEFAAIGSFVYQIQTIAAASAISYDVTGDRSAPFMFTVNASGAVMVNRNLTVELITNYTLSVSLYYTANPSQRTQTRILITVLRNQAAPVFTNASFSFSVRPSQRVGITLIRVAATDADSARVTYQLEASPAECKYHFYVNADNGDVILQQSVNTSLTASIELNCTVVASDNTLPSSRTTQVSVLATLLADSRPVWSKPVAAPISITLPESLTAGEILNMSSVFPLFANDSDAAGSVSYSFIGDYPASVFFTYNVSVRAIVVIRSLVEDLHSTDNFTIVLEAFDTLLPTISTRITILIRITRNINRPVFQHSLYRMNVLEAVSLGTVLQVASPVGAVVMATDADNETITYSLTSSTSSELQYFYMEPRTARVSLKAQLIAAGSSEFNFTIVATDFRGAQGFAILEIAVTRNLSRPLFAENLVNVTISENLATAALVYDSNATTSTLPEEIRYRLEGNIFVQRHFQVDANTGRVTIAQVLAGTSFTNIDVRIVAYSRISVTVGPELSSVLVLRLSILRNQNSPIFSPRSYSARVFDGIAVNALVLTLTAADADTGDSLSYSLSGSAEAMRYFYIERTTGRIRVARTIPRFDNQTYEFNATVSDNRIQEKTDTAAVAITAAIDSSIPFFTQPTNASTFTITISIDQAPMVELIAFEADRQNRSQPMVYSASGIYPATAMFKIWSNGSLYLEKSLAANNIRISNFTLLVETYDPVSPRAIGRLTVFILVELNPHPPNFTQPMYFANISEFAAVGSSVLQLTAADPVATDILTYSFVADVTVEIRTLFSIDSATGLMTLRAALTANTTLSYTFNVQVSDGTKSAISSVTILINRNRFLPVFNSLPPTVAVDETAAIGDRILTNINATDADGRGTVRYSLTGIGTATQFFSIVEFSGLAAITIKRQLVFDTSDAFNYTLRIVATESGAAHMSVSALLTVTVRRNINAPVFFGTRDSIYSATVNRYDPIGTVLVRVYANDTDLPNNPRSRVTYSIQTTASSSLFYINPNSGVVTTAAILDLETYVLTVIASDSYTPRKQSSQVVLSITVNLNSHTPAFLRPDYRVNISDAYPIGVGFLQVAAVDRDAEGTPYSSITYGLVSTSRLLGYFQIATSTGVISLRDSLLSAGITEARLTVIASDAGNPPRVGNSSLIVTVNKNSNATRFTESEIRITLFEDLALNASVVNLTAFDPDLRGRIRYAIAGDGLSASLFRIDIFSGQIRLAQLLTIDSGTLYTIRAIAFDDANPVEQAISLIYVTVVRNRNPPTFVTPPPFVVNIPETQPVGNFIIDINATDADRGASSVLTYSITNAASLPTDSSSWFYINPATGVMSVRRLLTLDSRQLTQYNVTVSVTDDGATPRSVSGVVVINVARNRNRPRFLNGTVTLTVQETLAVDSVVARLIAVDPDGDNVTYSGAGLPAVYYFDLRKTTGEVYLKYSLLNGLETVLNLVAVASDERTPAGTDSTQIVISIVRNPNGPQFTAPSYNFTVSEYRAVGSFFGAVSATDADPPESPGGQLRYSFDTTRTSNIAMTLFSVESSSGRISVNSPLWSAASRPSPTTYSLYITARDASRTSKSNSTISYVTVLRNEFAPTIVRSASINVTLSDLANVGSFILQLNASDADAAMQPGTNNSIVTFFIDPSNAAGTAYFYINPSSGRLTLLQSLRNNPANPDSYSFVIFARDSGIPARNDSVVVNVNVSKTVDTGARVLGFIQPQYTAEVPENAVIGSSVLDLDVVYQDTDKTVQCSFVSGNDAGYFDLIGTNGNKDCRLVTKRVIDREVVSRFDIQLNVVHAITTRRRKRQVANGEEVLVRSRRQTFRSYSTAKLLILVTDANDNAPSFLFPVYPNVTSTQNKYFGAVDMAAPANSLAATLNATDPDIGPNGQVTYARGRGEEATPRNPPFLVSAGNGEVRTSATFSTDSTIKYRFDGIATDAGSPLRLSSETEVIVNLIQDVNRMILVVPGPNRSPAVTIPRLEAIRQSLQRYSGQVILIEKVMQRNFLDGTQIRSDNSGTDIWFVCVDPVTYDICVRDNAATNNRFMTPSAINGITSALAPVTAVQTVRPPFSVSQGGLSFRKSYDALWVSGVSLDVWIALVTLAAFIIVTSVICIIFCFAHLPKKSAAAAAAARAPAYSEFGSQIGSRVVPPSLGASELNADDFQEEQVLEYNVAEEQIVAEEQPQQAPATEPNAHSAINPRFQGRTAF